MMRSDALKLYAWVMARYPHCGVTRQSFVEDLADVQPEHAWAAVKTLHRDGREFGPNGGKIVRQIVTLAVDTPEWYVVKAEIDRRRSRPGGAQWTLRDRPCPLGLCDGSGTIKPDDEDDRAKHELVARYCDCREQMLDELTGATGIHPLVNRFIQVVGRDEILALDGDRATEAQVRTKYEAFVADAEKAIAYIGIDTAGLSRLDRLQFERERMSELKRPGMTGQITEGEAA
jgi:hypothetical protein